MKKFGLIIWNLIIVVIFYVLYVLNRFLMAFWVTKLPAFDVWFKTDQWPDIRRVIIVAFAVTVVYLFGYFWPSFIAVMATISNFVSYFIWAYFTRKKGKPASIRDFYKD